ncbi:glycoside hydrolase family protein [Asticcacaulis sp.]|uniref:glycoside hydrolase family protein n=1 Tax=Asticcacaulis sp. TaxID=1872648 RepID=UPI002CC892C6|nr:glycoside hydrolase family protein [Asticcacaulis sp.]HTM81477.1 glycoside hydrolase family protein [Asticcacaulis sp.]
MRARQKVSRAGVELIKSFEGLRTAAARLPDGRWTLGYGHTFSAREGAKVTQEDADALLRFDLLPVVDSINNLILVPLNQNQFDALVSFCFNIGAENFAHSTVLKRINEGRFAEAALAMDSWRSAEFNGQTYVLAPLIRRRAAEKNLFLTPEEISHQAAMLGRPVEDLAGNDQVAEAAPDAGYINPYASAAKRQVIDLNAPQEAVVESLPQGFAAAQEAQRRLEDSRRAEVERLDAQREAEAARLREEARVQEQQRLDVERLEQARLEQARLEQAKLEQARIEAEAAEAARLVSIRAEAARQEQIRFEQARLEQARLEQVRIEAERLERERQAAEKAQAEQAHLEQVQRKQEEAAPSQAPQADDEAEKTRKAEAAAALMRLYSPYGGGNLGRPLGGTLSRKAVPEPQPAPPENTVSTPSPIAQSDLEFTNHSVISPSTVESTPFEISSRAEALSPEPEPETVVDFSPTGSASTMPAPVITALNPYAKPIPAATMAAAETEALVEVPRPAPVDFSAPSNAPIAAEISGLHWRDQLQRPLPQDYQAPQAARPEPEQPFLRAGPSSNFQTATYEDDNDTWMTNGDRIALSSENTEEEHDSLWQMIVKTLWWIIISAIGLGCLGIATGAWWQATHDQTVIRNGMVDSYTFISIGTAALGILFVSISVWLIMKRLGGLKD